MPRDFDYLLKKPGKEGARQVFEDACADVLKLEFDNAFPIECNPGDEGIDVFVGDFTAQIDVYQCKCFFDKIEVSQKSQIQKSFKKVISTKSYKAKEWILCIPKSLTISETVWWTKWKNKNEIQYKIKISLWDSTKLLLLIKKHNYHLELFDELEIQKLDIIIDELNSKKEGIKEILDTPEEINFTDKLFSFKLRSANINENTDVYNKQFFNAEIVSNEIKSKGIEKEVKELKSLKDTIQELWLTQYLKYTDTTDGNLLLGLVYERIENLDSTKTLSTQIEVSSSEKKGILHQLADECTVGWVRNYKEKLIEYKKSLI